MRQIGDESAAYYIASYVPTRATRDGSFRNLSIKVARPETKVVSRIGYFALPRIGGKAAMPFEIPLLKAAEGEGKEKDFTYKLGVERLTPGLESRHRVTIDLPVTTFTVQNDQSKKKYQLHFGVLVAAIRPNGEIAGKISQDYPMSGNLDRVDNLKKSSFDFARTLVIPPGKYTLRAIVHDYLAGKTGVVDKDLIVPEYGPSLGLANLVLLQTNDKGVITSNKHILINPEEKVKIGKDASLTFELGVFTGLSRKSIS